MGVMSTPGSAMSVNVWPCQLQPVRAGTREGGLGRRQKFLPHCVVGKRSWRGVRLLGQNWRAASIPPWHGGLGGGFPSTCLFPSRVAEGPRGGKKKNLYICIKHVNVLFIFLYTKCQTIKFANFSPCNCTVESSRT